MYFAGRSIYLPTYRSPAGILMASLGPCEKQREAFKLQANTPGPLSPSPRQSSHPPLPYFALYLFARDFNFNASRCPTQLRIAVPPLHFNLPEERPLCIVLPPSVRTRPYLLALFPRRPSARTFAIKRRRRERKKEEGTEGIPRAYTASCHSRELSTLASPSPFVPDIVTMLRHANIFFLLPEVCGLRYVHGITSLAVRIFESRKLKRWLAMPSHFAITKSHHCDARD